MLLRARALQLDAKNSNFENFESALYMKSLIVPLTNLILRVVSTQIFLKHIECCNFQTITVVYESIHFCNGNESKNPFLISIFSKNAGVFFRKWQKITFLGKKVCDKLKKIILSKKC